MLQKTCRRATSTAPSSGPGPAGARLSGVLCSAAAPAAGGVSACTPTAEQPCLRLPLVGCAGPAAHRLYGTAHCSRQRAFFSYSWLPRADLETLALAVQPECCCPELCTDSTSRRRARGGRGVAQRRGGAREGARARGERLGRRALLAQRRAPHAHHRRRRMQQRRAACLQCGRCPCFGSPHSPDTLATSCSAWTVAHRAGANRVTPSQT